MQAFGTEEAATVGKRDTFDRIVRLELKAQKPLLDALTM